MLCEKLVLEASKKVHNNQAYMFVRFGNVIGSRGSILPLFTEQLKIGGPLTVTDPTVQRYFMTIPEACSLVLKTGGVGQNGISYLLDMGEPIKILDIAEQIIRISGFEPYKDIPIQFIGLRKGERLDEPLWIPEENPQKTQHEKILQLQNVSCHFSLDDLLAQLKTICTDFTNKHYRDKNYLCSLLKEIVASYEGGDYE